MILGSGFFASSLPSFRQDLLCVDALRRATTEAHARGAHGTPMGHLMDTSWTWACYRLTRPPTAHPARPRSPARVCMCLCQVCVRRTAALASRLSAAYSTHRRLNTHTVSSVVSGGARVAHALSLTARRRPRGGLCSTARGSAHGWATSSSESAKSPPPPPPGHPSPPTQAALPHTHTARAAGDAGQPAVCISHRRWR